MEKTKEMASKRIIGIDILKVLSMFLVMMMHFLMYGGVLGACSYGTSQYDTAWLLECITFPCVNCFALITGYLCLHSRHRYSRLIDLWGQAVFYGLLFALLFQLLAPQLISTDDWFRAFTPVSHGSYWYLTAYVIMFIAMPFLNAGVEKTDERKLLGIITSIAVICIVLPLATRTSTDDPFKMMFGYSASWLCVMYLVGSGTRKYGWFIGTAKWKPLLLFAIVTSIDFSRAFWSIPTANWYRMVDYMSPTTIIASVSLFALFLNVNVENRIISSGWKRLAETSFGVYLIHVQPLVFNNILGGHFEFLGQLPAPALMIASIATVIGLYAVCTFIEDIRLTVSEKIGIPDKIDGIVSSICEHVKFNGQNVKQ